MLNPVGIYYMLHHLNERDNIKMPVGVELDLRDILLD